MKSYTKEFKNIPVLLQVKKEIAKAIDLGYKFDYTEMPYPLNTLQTENSLPHTRGDVTNTRIAEALKKYGYKVVKRKITSHKFLVCVNQDTKHGFVFVKKSRIEEAKDEHRKKPDKVTYLHSMALHNQVYMKTPSSLLTLIDMAPDLLSPGTEYDDVYDTIIGGIKHDIEAIIYVMFDVNENGVQSLVAMLPDENLDPIIYEDWSNAIEVEYPDDTTEEFSEVDAPHVLGIKSNRTLEKKVDEVKEKSEGDS